MEPEREDWAKRRQSSSKVVLSQTRRTLENELLTGAVGEGRCEERRPAACLRPLSCTEVYQPKMQPGLCATKVHAMVRT